MDQPQDDDANVNNDGQVLNLDTEQLVNNGFVAEPSTEEPVFSGEASIRPQDQITYEMPADAGAPEVFSTQPEYGNEQMVEAAEHQIEDASPQTTSEELAEVGSEIEAFEATLVPEVPVPTSSGNDPMEQILSGSASENQEISAGEIEPDPEMVNAPLPTEQTYSNPQLSLDTEAQQSESAQSVPVAEAMPVSVEPASVPVQNNPEVPQAAMPTPTTGGMINDVFVPSAVAAATAAGSSGANAITGTPEPSTVESSQDAMLANQKAQMPHKPKGKGLLIAVVVLVTLLLAGGAVAAYMMSQDSKDDTSSTALNSSPTDDIASNKTDSASASSTSRPGEKVEAVALDDYKAACAAGGLVTNAAAYAGASPHPIAMFEKGSDDKFALTLISFKDKTWSADPAKVTSAQLVGCIARKATSEVKLKSCPITDSTTKVTTNVDFYSTKYDVSVVEAKTGKAVSTFENSSSSTTCPTTAVYNKADPKIFAGFDLITLEASLKDPVTKTL
jgi:hypothetical protein